MHDYFNISVFTQDLRKVWEITLHFAALIILSGFHKYIFYKITLWFVQ